MVHPRTAKQALFRRSPRRGGRALCLAVLFPRKLAVLRFEVVGSSYLQARTNMVEMHIQRAVGLRFRKLLAMIPTPMPGDAAVRALPGAHSCQHDGRHVWRRRVRWATSLMPRQPGALLSAAVNYACA
jgi:hypothetical protein